MAKPPEQKWSDETKVLMGWSAVAMVGALVVTAGGALASYWLMTGTWILEAEGRRPKDVSDAIRIGLTLAAGVGAAVALVVAFRRQKVLEEDREGKRADGAADREVQRALHERYQVATAQLGHDNLTIRLAGVFALAAVADDWLARGDRGQVQVCIDVLCSYQRTGALEEDGSQLDVEVRQTITRVITAHLRPDASPTWRGLALDFTGAKFTGRHDFGGAVFSDSDVSFMRAEFKSGAVSFAGAVVSGGRLSFAYARLSGGHVFFVATRFLGGEVTFSYATLDGGDVDFVGAEFGGAKLDFSNLSVVVGDVRFLRAQFRKGRVSFDGAQFERGEVSFDGANFVGGEVSFGKSVLGPVAPEDGGWVVIGPWPAPPAPLPKVYPLPATKEQG